MKSDALLTLEYLVESADKRSLPLSKARQLAGFILHARALTDEERRAIKTLLRATSPKNKATESPRIKRQVRRSQAKAEKEKR